jgi:hypothetical protein
MNVEPPAPAAPPPPASKPPERMVPRAFRAGITVLRTVPREIWLIALALVVMETGCEYVATRYRTNAVTSMELSGRELRDDAGNVVEQFEPGEVLTIQNGFLIAFGETLAIVGTRAGTGPEAVGWTIGAWLASVPLVLLLIALEAWLSPRYLRAQWRALGLAPVGTAASPPYRALYGACFVGRGAEVGAAAVAALPGLLILIVGGLTDVAAIAWVGAVVVVAAATFAYVYTRLGVMFVVRVLLFEGRSLPDAARRSWGMARGRRWSLLWLSVMLGTVDMIGALGWGLGVVGLLTHPLARVIRDGGFTRVYADLWVPPGAPDAPPIARHLLERRGPQSPT